MACAHYLQDSCDVHLLEAGPRLGGHTATVDVLMMMILLRKDLDMNCHAAEKFSK